VHEIKLDDYRMATFVRPGVNPKTANKDISALSSLWKFAMRRALVDSIPWAGQSLTATNGGAERIHKLPFEDHEVARLLRASSERLPANHLKPSPMLKDAITILALSGMRVEELARMKVADLRDSLAPCPTSTSRAARPQPRAASSPSIPTPCRSSCGGAKARMLVSLFSRSLPLHQMAGSVVAPSPRRSGG
jgi:integrase